MAFDFTGEVAIVTGAGSRLAGNETSYANMITVILKRLFRRNRKRQSNSHTSCSPRSQSGIA